MEDEFTLVKIKKELEALMNPSMEDEDENF
jgi:hypothetical protein